MARYILADDTERAEGQVLGGLWEFRDGGGGMLGLVGGVRQLRGYLLLMGGTFPTGRIILYVIDIRKPLSRLVEAGMECLNLP